MSDTSPDDLGRITDYVAGEIAPEEREAIEAWIAQDHERHAVMDSLKKTRELLHERDERSADPDAVLRRVFAHLHAGPSSRTSQPVRTGTGGLRGSGVWKTEMLLLGKLQGWLWSVSAVVVVALVILLPRWGLFRNPGITRTYATNAGQRATVTLDDGTTVFMAPHTTLRLVRFGYRERRIVLDDGETYFKVEPSNAAPFIVQSGHVITRVLGTTFLIRRRLGDARVHVAVATGKVAVSVPALQRPAMTVAGGYIADVTDSATIVRVVDSTEMDRWSNDAFVFHNVPMVDVLETISRWYGYQFRFGDSALVRKNVTMWVSTQSSADALASVKRLLNVTLTVVGDTVTITQNRSSTRSEKLRYRNYNVFTPTREVGR